MTIHQLRILLAVAKYLNFRKAANELHLSQPSVFVQFKNLEEEFGLKFYKRDGRGIELTQDGKLFIRFAGEVLSQVNHLEKAFKSKLDETKGGPLKVGGTLGPSAAFLPIVLGGFTKSHPTVRPTLRNGGSKVIERMVLDAEIDIGVITKPSSSPALSYEHCRREKIAVFASAKHYPNKGKLTLGELAAAPLVFNTHYGPFSSGTGSILQRLEKEGFGPNIIMNCDSPEAVKAAVKIGMGIGMLYRDLVEADVKRGDLKIIKVPELEIEFDSFITIHKERPLGSVAQDFLTFLRHWPQNGHRKGAPTRHMA